MSGAVSAGSTARRAGGHRHRHRRRLLVAAAAFLVGLLAIGAAVFGPAGMRNLATSVQGVDTTAVLGDQRASVLVPAGWHLVRPVGSSDRLALETPDSRFEIMFALAQRPGSEATLDLSALGSGTSAPPVSAWNTERPAPGLEVVFARIGTGLADVGSGERGFVPFHDGSPTTVALVAAAHPHPPSAAGTVVDIVARVDGAPDAYLAEFARVVGSLEFL